MRLSFSGSCPAIERFRPSLNAGNPSASVPKSERGRPGLSGLLGLVIFFLRLSRGSAQDENQAGYRRELYQEDKDRMKIETDSVHFDTKLLSNVRLAGDFVYDSISGASPTGAPPQTRWPFPTFAHYYNLAYGQLFLAAVNDPNNHILYDSGYFASYHDYTNYIALNNPQIGSQATNSASKSYGALTSNRNIRNTTVPLTEVHDRRTAGSLSAPITFGIHQITPSIAYSEESDYISWGGAFTYSLSLNDKNTTLNAGYAHNSDNVKDDVGVWEDKTSDDFLLGVVQLVTPKSYFTLNLTYGTEAGYLSDPYRGVMPASNFLQTNPDDAALLAEKRPRHRTKEIVYASWTQFITPLKASVDLGYRLFHDSSGIYSHTIDLSWHQKIGRSVVISPTFRYNYQTAAYFYYVLVPDFNNLPQFYSSDYRLSQLQTFGYGISITYRIQKWVSLDASYLRYVMEGLDGVTSPSAYPSANVFSLGMRLWF